jgi:hypothetical protein
MVDVAEIANERLGGVVQGDDPCAGLERERPEQWAVPVDLARFHGFTDPASIIAVMIAVRRSPTLVAISATRTSRRLTGPSRGTKLFLRR